MKKTGRKLIAVWMCGIMLVGAIPTKASILQRTEKTDIDIPIVLEETNESELDLQYHISEKWEGAESDKAPLEGICGANGSNVTWKLDDGALTLSGSGATADFERRAPWYNFSSEINAVYVSEGITYIGEAAFYGCSSLKQVTLPSSLTVIGKGAFAKCGELTTISLPWNLTSIGDYAFQNSGLWSLKIPESVKTLGEFAVSYCSNLQEAEISSQIMEIKKGTFYNDPSLRNIVLKKGLKNIGEGAFALCGSLKSVTLPSSIKSILDNAFSSETEIKNLPDEYSRLENGTIFQAARVKVKVKEQYKEAFSVLNIVNKERKKKGLAKLKMDKMLLEAAMVRAAEISLYFNHTRPSGYICFSASDLMSGENIAAGYGSASSVMTGWMNSPGHRANILREGYQSIGIGCIDLNGVKYWVQCFGGEVSSNAKASAYKNRNKTRTLLVSTKKTYFTPKITVSSSKIPVGGGSRVNVSWNNRFRSVSLPVEGLKYKTSKKSVCTVSKGKIKGRKKGTAKIKIWFPGYKKGAVTKKITVR